MRWKGEMECTGAWNMLWLRISDHEAFLVVGALTFGGGPPSARLRGRAARPGVRSERFELFLLFFVFLCYVFAVYANASMKGHMAKIAEAGGPHFWHHGLG